MKRTLNLFLLLLLSTVFAFASGGSLKGKLESLKGISGIEPLESSVYPEKYLLRVTQLVDPKAPSAGTFTQRVVVCHRGFDRPTVLVTEGYNGDYALRPAYADELSQLFNTNVIVVEYRYFKESTPSPKNWDYLTAENSAYDLHNVNRIFRQLYNKKWISTGISKGGQTTCLYRAYFPDDVDFSVPYVAPLNRGVEDGRHEIFLQYVGTQAERDRILAFQRAVLAHKAEIVPLLDAYCREKQLTFRIPMEEVLDYSVLEYPFAIWQWGTPVETIPDADASTQALFENLMTNSEPSYFSNEQPYVSFDVQACRELGYYGYDTDPLQDLLTIRSTTGYLNKLMLPKELVGKVEFRPELYHKVHDFLKYNDPKMIFIYGEIDPWSASRVPSFGGKKNEQIYIQPRGSHRARIGNMPEEMKSQIIAQIEAWLAE